jgi:PAS domain S-box-containing protein
LGVRILSGEKVLIIDDKPQSVEVLAEYLLRPNGYDPIVATDAAHGLELALTERPDLIILDQKMPKMSGLDVLRQLRERSEDVPVILITAFGTESVIIEALRLGACDYILKPYDMDEMLKAVQKSLQDSQVRRKREHAWEELQDRVKQLQSLYGMSLEKALNLVAEAAVRVTGAEESYLLLVDESTNELYLRAEKNLEDKVAHGLSMRVEDSIAGHVVQTGQPVLFNPLEAEQRFRVKTGYFVHSLINVPLKMGERVIGVLGVGNKLRQELFTRVDVDLLASLADHAAIAIENANLFSSIRTTLGQRMMELSAIQTLSREFNRTPDPDRVASLVLDQVMLATNTKAGMIGLLIDGDLAWTSRGYLQEVFEQGMTPKWDQGIVGRVTKTGQPALVHDISTDPDWRYIPPQTRSALVVPILRNDKVIGVICLQSTKRHDFDAEKLRFIATIASHTSVALEKAQLLNAVVEEQRKTKMVLSSMADGVYTVDRDLRILSWNRAAERITGWKESEIVGKLCRDVLQALDMTGRLSCDRDCLLREAMETGLMLASGNQDREISHRSGHRILISCSAAPLLDYNDEVVGGVCVFRDVSSERMLERMKSEFIAMVSHQLRSPLASIMASVELLGEPDLESALQQEMVQLVGTQCDELSRFVNEIVNVAQLESGKVMVNVQPMSLKAVTHQVLSVFRTQNPNRRFVERVPEELAPVSGDLEKTSIVLRNLVDNAVKYSAEDKPVLVEVLSQEDEVVIRVIDRGVGIPAEHLDKLFKWFHRVDGSDTQEVYGSGLGLYVAKKLIELQGGRIWVQSKVDQGSCFSFSLPWWDGEHG